MAKKETFNVSETIEVRLDFFAVRSKDGKWLRSKGYGGGGESWVTDITKAKIYGRIGPARAQVTFWAKNYPEFGIPDIVHISTGQCHILSEEDRVVKAIEKIKREEIESKIRYAKGQIEYYKRKILEYGTKAIEAKEKELEKYEQELKKLIENDDDN